MPIDRRPTFHLIASAHLDPVWLWDWREGLNEGLITCRTILDLMDEDADFTFIRGESIVYQHIQQTDPETFARIKRRVKEGRWEIVGGTVVQPDMNLPGTESLARQFLHGKRYFKQHFGKEIDVGWSADCFGHAAGLPEILAAAGISAYAFSRPHHATLPITKPAFWWEGPGGSRILAYRPKSGWYCSERESVPSSLDELLIDAQATDLQNFGFFYGLGNHGGGPTRRLLADIRAWAKDHPEVNVIHSGLRQLFGALRREIKQRGEAHLPVHKTELNFCLRGCYASMMKFKSAYRKAENLLARAERTDAVISAYTASKSEDVKGLWQSVLFNAFHDILPGSSIERAYEDQLAWIGCARHGASVVEHRALNTLASQIDTRVAKPTGDHPSAVAVMLWNPHPTAFDGHVEIEASLDYRPIWKYSKGNDAELPVQLLGPDGKPRPFQAVTTEHIALEGLSWRKRVVTPVHLPSFGWSIMEFGWVEKPKRARVARPKAVAVNANTIANDVYRITATPGTRGVRVAHCGKDLFSDAGLSAVLFRDPWGAWGGMSEEHDSIYLREVLESWNIERVEVLESGPERAVLWVRFAGKQSWMELSFALCAGRRQIDVSARLLFNERSARLKLVMPDAQRAEFEVPGGAIIREPSGEVPGGRWVRVFGEGRRFGFASDALYCFDCADGAFRATVVRATRPTSDTAKEASDRPWQPSADCGELCFRFLIDDGGSDLPTRAHHLEQPPVVALVPPHKGSLSRSGSLATLSPTSLQLLALKEAWDGRGYILRIRQTGKKTSQASLSWLGTQLDLGCIGGGKIVTFRLRKQSGKWRAELTSVTEG